MVQDGGGRYHWLPGDIKLSARDDDDPGWLMCDGKAYSVYDHVNLFAEIGYKFGGSGTMFNVPNFERSVPVGVGGTGTDELANTIGSTGGEETHHLQPDEMVPLGGTTGGAGSTRAGNYSGQGDAFNIMQPSVVVAFYIKT